MIAHNKKPRVKPFKTALRRLKLNPSEVPVVGNDIQRDILEAKKLSIMTAFAYYSEHKPCREADFVLKDFGELVGVV